MDFFTDYAGIDCGFEDAALCGFSSSSLTSVGSYENRNTWARRNQFSGTQYPNHFLATHTDAGKDHDTFLGTCDSSGKGSYFPKHFFDAHSALHKELNILTAFWLLIMAEVRTTIPRQLLWYS